MNHRFLISNLGCSILFNISISICLALLVLCANVELLAVWLIWFIGSKTLFQIFCFPFLTFLKVFPVFNFHLFTSQFQWRKIKTSCSWDWAGTVWAVSQKRRAYWDYSLLVYRYPGQQLYAEDFASKAQNNFRQLMKISWNHRAQKNM